MASINITVRKNPKGTAKVILVFNYGRKKRCRYSTKYVLPQIKYWDKRLKKVKLHKEIPDASKINDELNELVKAAQEFAYEYSSNEEELDNDIIKEKLDEIVENIEDKDKPKRKKTEKKVDEEKSQSVIKYFDWFIDYYATHPRPRTSKPYPKETLKGIKSSRKLINSFQKKVKHIKFKDVTLDLHSKLFDYLRNEKEYSLNYTGAVIKNLKTIMNDAFERGFHSNLDYKKSGFTVPKEDVDNIYLNQDELKRISELDISKIDINPQKHPEIFNKHDSRPTYDGLDRVRDWLLIGCNVGLRVGNLLDLTSKNLETIYDSKTGEELQIIKTKASKGNGIVEIPLSSTVKAVISKHEGNFPKTISKAKYNKWVKLICKSAKITEEFEGEPKYLSVSSHTCRRTFCTNAYKSGMNTLDIMQISGHKSEKTFLKYIKATSRDRLEKIRNERFFR